MGILSTTGLTPKNLLTERGNSRMVQIIKERTRHGWNINGQSVPNWVYLKAQAKRNPPRWTLIMDNQDRAREWKDEIGGEMTYRSWGEGEGDLHHTMKPEAAAQLMAKETEKVFDCWQYWKMNEPSTGDTVAGWLKLQDWLIAYATEAKKHNRKVTTNGLALGKNVNYPDFVKVGHTDKLIKYWADNRDTFIVNVHSYFTGAAWSSVMPNYPANLFDLNITRNGRTQGHIQWDSYYPEMWYFREAWITNVRAKEIIGEPMDFIIDECWFDYHASVHQAVVVLPDGRRDKMDMELRNRYGDSAFDREMKGILGQRKFAEWAITGQLHTPVSDEVYCDWLIQNYQWLENEYPDNALAFMNYTMNPMWRYPNSGGGGFGHDANPLVFALLPRMATIKPRHATPTPTPSPVPQPEPVPTPESAFIEFRVRSTASDGQNIRSKTVLTPNTVIGKLPPPPAIVTLKAAPADTPSDINDLQWREIIYGTIRGFVAWKYVEVVTTPIPIPMDYKSQLIEAYRQENEADNLEIQRLMQRIRTRQDAIEDLAETTR